MPPIPATAPETISELKRRRLVLIPVSRAPPSLNPVA